MKAGASRGGGFGHLFTTQAASYAHFRPDYPASLYQRIWSFAGEGRGTGTAPPLLAARATAMAAPVSSTLPVVDAVAMQGWRSTWAAARGRPPKCSPPTLTASSVCQPHDTTRHTRTAHTVLTCVAVAVVCCQPSIRAPSRSRPRPRSARHVPRHSPTNQPTIGSTVMFVGAATTDNVEYRVGLAEALEGIEDESVDLLTTAQAAHWFQLEPFYRELDRVLKPSTPSTIVSLSSSSSTTLIHYQN